MRNGPFGREGASAQTAPGVPQCDECARRVTACEKNATNRECATRNSGNTCTTVLHTATSGRRRGRRQREHVGCPESLKKQTPPSPTDLPKSLLCVHHAVTNAQTALGLSRVDELFCRCWDRVLKTIHDDLFFRFGRRSPVILDPCLGKQVRS